MNRRRRRKPEPDWRESLTFAVHGDSHVTKCWRFELFPILKDGSVSASPIFTSDLAYTSEADATLAANDAAHAAWLFRNWVPGQ